MRTTPKITLSLLALALPGPIGAQTLRFDPPRVHLNSRPFSGPEILTFNLQVDYGIESAVSWGTDITLGSTSLLEFVNYGDTNLPFRASQPFFDTDLSDYSDAGIADGDAILHLNFINFSDPFATFGQTGKVTLGQIQVRVKQEPGYPENSGFGGLISLSAPGIPPYGSAVLDSDGNNLIFYAGGSIITSRPPTPEPAAWLLMLVGTGGAALFRRRTVMSDE